MAWVRGEQRDPDKPEPGFYALRLVKKGPEVAAEIYRDTIRDGLFNWCGVIDGKRDGEYVSDPQLSPSVQQIWLFGRKISAQEYNFMIARAAHARLYDPASPWANPTQPIDLRTLKPL